MTIDIKFFWGIFNKKECRFLHWVFLLRNCQVLSVFWSSLTSNSFLIRNDFLRILRILLIVSDPTGSRSTVPNTGFDFPFLQSVSHVCRLRVLLVPRSGLHTSLSLSNEVRVIVCPGFADSISEGDIRYRATLSSSNDTCNLYPAVKAEWSLSCPGCTDSISEGDIRYRATLSSSNGTRTCTLL